MPNQYTAYLFQGTAAIDEPWDGPNWLAAEEARIEHFHAASSPHRPVVRAKLMYDAANLYLRFRVEDRYVVAKHTEFQDPVWRDSCVEFFVQPRESGGYFNFEINCGGALLSYYIEDPRRTPDGFVKFTRLSGEQGRMVRITHSLLEPVVPEIQEPTEWQIACAIPLEVLKAYTGPLGPLGGQTWRGNFFKCADDSSHPHWASWAPIGEELNFHQPKYFGSLRFEPAAERVVGYPQS